MTTLLPESIKTIEEAKIFLTTLYFNGESFHPEDDANDCLEGIATKEEGDKLNSLMEDIYNLEGNDGRHTDLMFDPCEWLIDLHQDPKESTRNYIIDELKSYEGTDFVVNDALIDFIESLKY